MFVKHTIQPVVLCTALLSACASDPSQIWIKAGVSNEQKELDIQTCDAYGRREAGPQPQQEPMPVCSGGFACGNAKGSVAAKNGLAMGNWSNAFQTAFDACMHRKEYIQDLGNS